MSWFEPVTVECPSCGGSIETATAETVNVTRLPIARRSILDGSFHRPTCERCGEAVSIDRTFLFTDLDRRQFVMVFPHSFAGAWDRWERVTEDTWDRTFEGQPTGVVDDFRRFRVRTVFGVPALAEKLRIWQAGLDDALVEILKLRLIRDEPELHGRADLALTVTDIDVDADQGVIEAWSVDGERPALRYGFSTDALRRPEAQRDLLIERFPGLFFRPFVGYRRLGRERTSAAA